jgi:hypothetical protein
MRKLLLAGTVVLLMATGTAHAGESEEWAERDKKAEQAWKEWQKKPAKEYPYREDGPERDWFLQSSIASCIKSNGIQAYGSQKEVLAFCECKWLFLADIYAADDVSWWRDYHKLSAQMDAKFIQGDIACKQHFSKLPKVLVRKKAPQ